MLMKILFAALAVGAGVATALQVTVNAGLARSAGLGPTLIVNTVVVLAGAIVLWAALGARTTFFPPEAPWTSYVGGLFGFVIIAGLTFVLPKIGAGWAIVLTVFGQSVAALCIDHYGLMGMPVIAITPQRLAGLALVAAGAAVIRL